MLIAIRLTAMLVVVAVVSAFLLGAGTLGNVRTQCLRAFTVEEMSAILSTA